jgi:hypothetical protein
VTYRSVQSSAEDPIGFGDLILTLQWGRWTPLSSAGSVRGMQRGQIRRMSNEESLSKAREDLVRESPVASLRIRGVAGFPMISINNLEDLKQRERC